MLVSDADAPGGHFDSSMEELTKLFYQRFFPFDRIHRWLSYSSGVKFSRREFSMTLPNQAYLRFQSFSGEPDLREKIVSMNPTRIDIGAVYSARPSEKKSIAQGSFVPVEKELVFDIDMTDYDDIRTCCQDKRICRCCWRFVASSIKLLDNTLRSNLLLAHTMSIYLCFKIAILHVFVHFSLLFCCQSLDDFGFEHILWVFSGRRGAHGWICDDRARSLDTAGRKAIVSYLEMVRGGSEKGKKVHVSTCLPDGNFHPMVKRSLDLLKPIFTKHYLYEQDILSSDEKARSLLSLFSSDDGKAMFVSGCLESWKKSSTNDPLGRWESLVEHVDQAAASKKKGAFSVRYAIEEVLLQCTYPRLDANVSIGVNHLLKSPFCVHPDTGRICVPLLVDSIDEFDVERDVPRIADLTNTADGISILAPFFQIFDSFLEGLERAVTLEKQAKRGRSLVLIFSNSVSRLPGFNNVILKGSMSIEATDK